MLIEPMLPPVKAVPPVTMEPLPCPWPPVTCDTKASKFPTNLERGGILTGTALHVATDDNRIDIGLGRDRAAARVTAPDQ